MVLNELCFVVFLFCYTEKTRWTYDGQRQRQREREERDSRVSKRTRSLQYICTSPEHKTELTGSAGAGILAKAGRGGEPPLSAFEEARAATTERLRRGATARDAIVVV